MRRPALFAAIPLLALAACATPQGPIEVTRFVAPDGAAWLGQGTVFVESAPGSIDGLEAAPYKAAVAAELTRLGYRESARDSRLTLSDFHRLIPSTHPLLISRMKPSLRCRLMT